MDDGLAPFCASCCATKAINWAPAFGVWLCAPCRWSRCERELNTPVTVLPLPVPEVR
jgi:hypothetical protein